MPIRTYRVNFRTRGGIDTRLWNTFFRNLEQDLDDITGSGAEPMLSEYIGTSGLFYDYDIAVSGMAGKEEI